MSTTEPTEMAAAGAWLRRASQDMRAAAHGMSADPPLLDDVVFHCQQAAEKSLRGFLAWNGVQVDETNDLAEIGARCVEIDTTLEPIVAEATPLTEYAWRYRYPGPPGEPEEPSAEETQHAMSVTHAVATAVLERLPDEAHQR